MSDDQYGDYSRRGDYEDPYSQDPYAGRRGYRTRGTDPNYPARGEEAYPPAGGTGGGYGRGDTAYPRSYGRDYSGRSADYAAADGTAGPPVADDYHSGGYASGYPGGADYAGEDYASPREQRSYRRGEYRPRGEYGRRGDPYGSDTRSRRDVLGVIASSLFAVLAVLALIMVVYLIFKPDKDPGTAQSNTTPSAASQDPTSESTDENTAPPENVTAPVVVLNATGINGLAAKVTEEIGAADWETREPGNYQEGVVEETTVFFPNEEMRPAAEALMEAFPNITAIEQGDDTMAQDALTVVLASEWN